LRAYVGSSGTHSSLLYGAVGATAIVIDCDSSFSYGAAGKSADGFAEMPPELQGRWSSHPARCEPVSGEVDVLTITAADLSFYEVGCALGKSTRSGTSLMYDAQCYKEGSPVRPGKVILERRAPNEIDLKLEGFLDFGEIATLSPMLTGAAIRNRRRR